MRARAWPKPSRRLDEPAIDPPCTADLPDETPDPRSLPAWMRQPLLRPALPRSVAALPQALTLPARTAQPQAEYELVDGPAPECVDVPVPDEAAEVDTAKLPAWMRGGLERGPPELEEAQAVIGAAQDDTDDLPPEL